MNRVTDIKINRLPAPTWRHLGMNSTEIKDILIPKQTDALASFSDNITEIKADGDFWKRIKTGLGSDMEVLAYESGAEARAFKASGLIGCTETLRLDFDFKEEASISEIAVYAEEDSETTVIMTYRGTADKAQAVVRTKLFLEKNAKIKLIQLRLLENGITLLNDVGAVCGENASVELIQLVLGGDDTYMGCDAVLEGENASFSADIGYRLGGKTRLDMSYNSEHMGRNTKSRLNASGVLEDKAFKIFRGTIDFQNGSGGAKGNENEEVLLLSDNAVNQTIPLILCAEEDVEGNHGASIGKPDDELMFYMQSRGIDEKSVYEMLANSRINGIIGKIEDDTARNSAFEFINGGGDE